MLVAIIKNSIVLSINEYPKTNDIKEIEKYFNEFYTLVDVTNAELPEYRHETDTMYYIGGEFKVEEGV